MSSTYCAKTVLNDSDNRVGRRGQVGAVEASTGCRPSDERAAVNPVKLLMACRWTPPELFNVPHEGRRGAPQRNGGRDVEEHGETVLRANGIAVVIELDAWRGKGRRVSRVVPGARASVI